jgi:hypothetical protein
MIDPRQPGNLKWLMEIYPQFVDRRIKQVHTDYEFALRNQLIDSWGVNTFDDLCTSSTSWTRARSRVPSSGVTRMNLRTISMQLDSCHPPNGWVRVITGQWVCVFRSRRRRLVRCQEEIGRIGILGSGSSAT